MCRYRAFMARISLRCSGPMIADPSVPEPHLMSWPVPSCWRTSYRTARANVIELIGHCLVKHILGLHSSFSGAHLSIVNRLLRTVNCGISVAVHRRCIWVYPLRLSSLRLGFRIVRRFTFRMGKTGPGTLIHPRRAIQCQRAWGRTPLSEPPAENCGSNPPSQCKHRGVMPQGMVTYGGSSVSPRPYGNPHATPGPPETRPRDHTLYGLPTPVSPPCRPWHDA